MANQYPSLWSRAGPRETIRPEGFFDRIRWRMILFWNRPDRTIRMGALDEDAEFDDLGSWARFKRMVTRSWTSKLRRTNKYCIHESAISLEDANDATELIGSAISKATDILASPVTHPARTVPGGMLDASIAPGLQTQQRSVSSRLSSMERPTSQSSSKGRNSSVMIEEERPTWLQDLSKGVGLPAIGGSRAADQDKQSPSHNATPPGTDPSHDG
ncbi:MAG: hypothetical protein Q9195_000313 [Heterodermia aff. obscurata]